jgi:hypothetical protein
MAARPYLKPFTIATEPSGKVSDLLDGTAQHALRIVPSLTERGVLVSNNPHTPLPFAFPAALASRRMSCLLPERVV